MRKNKKTHFMAGILMVLFIGVFLIILGRFLYIQVSGEINNVSLADWAKEKRMSTFVLDSERGKIYDSNGMTLAYDRPTFRVYAIVDKEHTGKSKEVKHVKDPAKTAKALAPLLDMKESLVLEHLQAGIDGEKFQVEFGNSGKELTQDTKDAMEKLNLPGIHFENESIRYYPNGMFASHIIGFARREMVDQEDDEEMIEEVIGVSGIENEMNELLGGEDGYVSYQRDKYNRKLLDPDEVIKKPINGDDVYLTIDQKVQTLLEDVMTEVGDKYDPERITAVVMNAKTGEIIAMSNRPSYNPNDPSDIKNWYNDVISTPFEPGSTVKMFTWAAAIDAGVYNGNELFKSGSYQINERIPKKVNDHNYGKGWGSITYDEGFARSSNVATAKLVWEKLGTEEYLEYLKAFHFDKKTGIDLPGELSGRLLYNWPQEKVTTGFGQGSTLTPIQQMKAATAITNKGKMLEPYVIKKIVDSETDKVIEESTPKVVGKPISEETAKHVMDLLDSVVNSKHGTGKPYKLDYYSVIGKTGTAQIPDPNGPGYLTDPNSNIYSFLGMAPKDDPELIMYVAVNQPKLGVAESGSAPVSYIFKNVIENSLRYLDIAPDKVAQEPVVTIKVPKHVGQNTKAIEKDLLDKGLKVTVIGKGKEIVSSSNDQGSELFTNDHIILLTDKPTMPDITGWSLRDVHKLADLIEFKLELVGNGYVITQSIKKDAKIKKDDYLGVEFKPPKEFKTTKENDDKTKK